MIFRSVTLQEANSLLPVIKDHFSNIHALVAEGQLIHARLDGITKTQSISADGEVIESVAPRRKRGQKVDKEHKERLDAIEKQIQNEVLQMQLYGAVVKSVFPGRVDFFSHHHTQPAFLCWQMGEKSVKHWHPLDEGYGSRRRITSPKAFGPYVVH